METAELADRIAVGAKKGLVDLPPDQLVDLTPTERRNPNTGRRMPKLANPGIRDLPVLHHVQIRGNGLQLHVSPGEWIPDTQVGDPTFLLDRWVDCNLVDVSIFGAKPDDQKISGAGWEAQAGFLAVATTGCVWTRCHVEDVYGDGWEFLGAGIDPTTGRSMPNLRPVLDACTSWGVGRNVITAHAVTDLRLTGRHHHAWWRNDLVHWEERKRADRYWVRQRSIRRDDLRDPGTFEMSKKAMQRAGLTSR